MIIKMFKVLPIFVFEKNKKSSSFESTNLGFVTFSNYEVFKKPRFTLHTKYHSKQFLKTLGIHYFLYTRNEKYRLKFETNIYVKIIKELYPNRNTHVFYCRKYANFIREKHNLMKYTTAQLEEKMLPKLGIPYIKEGTTINL